MKLKPAGGGDFLNDDISRFLPGHTTVCPYDTFLCGERRRLRSEALGPSCLYQEGIGESRPFGIDEGKAMESGEIVEIVFKEPG